MEFNFTFGDVVRKDLEKIIIDKFTSMGLMFRIFTRNKSCSSLSKKIKSNPKYGSEKKIQDSIGIRVVLYFNDDIDIAHHALNSIFKQREKDQSIDQMNTKDFSAIRYNIVYEIPNNLIKSNNSYSKFSMYIDNTFELQIRTVLSEGWHEVEHDLRYKAQRDWEGSELESRKLNGIYATLETSEWTMLKIFDELAYKHYKNGKWESMLRQKMRMRINDDKLDPDIERIFNENKSVAKEFYRVSRNKMLKDMSKKNFSLPITLNSLVYFCNLLYVKSEAVSGITPSFFVEEFIDN